MKDTEKPIAILTINKDISKMTKQQREMLVNWLDKQTSSIEQDYEQYGKCRMRLFK